MIYTLYNLLKLNFKEIKKARTSNEERFKIGLPQIIIEDNTQSGNIFSMSCDEMDQFTLNSMYLIQDQILKLFSLCEITETEANTINPCKQNIFLSLKSWRIKAGESYIIVSIKQRFSEGCFAEMYYL